MIECPKCKHEHEPSGDHEEDNGLRECEKCKFEFKVEVEYCPSYISTCVAHAFTDEWFPSSRSPDVEYRFCVLCNNEFETRDKT